MSNDIYNNIIDNCNKLYNYLFNFQKWCHNNF